MVYFSSLDKSRVTVAYRRRIFWISSYVRLFASNSSRNEFFVRLSFEKKRGHFFVWNTKTCLDAIRDAFGAPRLHNNSIDGVENNRMYTRVGLVVLEGGSREVRSNKFEVILVRPRFLGGVEITKSSLRCGIFQSLPNVADYTRFVIFRI